MTFVAQSDRDGTVNVRPKGSTIIIDDDTLAYAESVAEKKVSGIILREVAILWR